MNDIKRKFSGAAVASVLAIMLTTVFAGPAAAGYTDWSKENPNYKNIPGSYCSIKTSRNASAALASGCGWSVRVQARFREHGVNQTTSWGNWAQYAHVNAAYPYEQRAQY
jgi:hypothetical protein